MGAGIAQLACLSGARTLLHDPVPEALERGLEAIRAQLHRGVERGRLKAGDASAGAARLEAAPTLEDLAPCELVIEAAPESVEVKQALFARLADGIVDRGLRAGDEHLLAAGERDRLGRLAARAGRRYALLQPAAGDGTAGGRGRRGELT